MVPPAEFRVDWWDEVRLALQGFLDHHGALAAFVLILIEESGVPVPVPGDFLMLGVGAHARDGRPPLWQALLVMEAATLVGASVLYFLSARTGRTLVYRYGRYMHLTEERLDRAESWLQRRGAVAIVLGRVTPGLRMATVIACGVFGYPYWRFLPALALGAFLYILMYTLLGYFFGMAVLAVVEGVHLPLGLFGSLIPLVLIIVWVIRARRGLHMPNQTEASTVDRRHRWRDGAVAGGLATVVSTLALNVAVHLSGDLALLPPGDLIEHARARFAVLALVRVIGPVMLLAATPAFMAVGVVWGAIYAEFVEPHLHYPDWLAGMSFALLPLGVALVVVLPILDGAAPELGPLGPLAAASEALRHIAYGAALGLIYPLRLARKPQFFRAHARPRMDTRSVQPAV
ncbi:MAG TPA: DedA family protein [Chloroflexota bacterium]|nr:DedA family protein [Chloroflexota bacterium]